ncbi:MAG: leucyl aminopeptidase [Gammaproteobacteria bacterium]|nr:leucyl aminopeptidase [Gammaproteobacteria bacterium]
MFTSFLTDHAVKAIALLPIDQAHYSAWLKQQDALTQQWLATVSFNAEPGQICCIPDATGHIKQVLVGVNPQNSLWSLADCPKQLPAGSYELQDQFALLCAEQAALGWGLASYRFDRYSSNKQTSYRQLIIDSALLKKVTAVLEACYWVRNLINTPAEDMGPEHLSSQARNLAERYQAQFTEIVGKDLLNQGYAGIYTVGRAAVQAPRLIDIHWGKSSDPKITLVGKGVCFDSGGLNLKPADNMLLMRKDMGLADALSEASQDHPELLIDFATLTGAARMALGTSLPALFSNRDELAFEIAKLSKAENDPMWPMPLFAPYKRLIKGKFADLTNNPGTGMGGAITAALFLECFVDENIPWLHIDLMAWNDSNQPGRPEGGEAMGMRALFAYLAKRYIA